MKARKRCSRTGKVTYGTQEAAARAAIRRAVRFHDPLNRVYRCEFCSRWHLTTQVARA